jgi:oligopeptide/dipeptide ABC transporter ATP-binding protein
LIPIPGAPPSPGQTPSGCVFHPRCPVAIESCSVERPALVAISPDRASRCPVVTERGPHATAERISA